MERGGDWEELPENLVDWEADFRWSLGARIKAWAVTEVQVGSSWFADLPRRVKERRAKM